MVLVTGGTGLLGSHVLLQLLRKNEEVRATYRNEAHIKKAQAFFQAQKAQDLFFQIEWCKADVTDLPALEHAFTNIEYVYHCAALVSFDPKDELLLRKTNIEGTSNMVNLAIDHHIKKFCHVSSIATLDNTIDKPTITESSEWNPNLKHSDYAISKFGAEMEVWRGSQEGLDVVIVNPGIILGSAMSNSGNYELFDKVEKEFPFYTYGIAPIVDADDVATLMIQLMQSDFKNERYILVGENIPYQDLLNRIATLLNKKNPSLYAAPWMTSLAWRLDYVISLLTTKKRNFTRQLANASHSQVHYDNSKITSTVNFTFTPVSQSLEKLLESRKAFA